MHVAGSGEMCKLVCSAVPVAALHGSTPVSVWPPPVSSVVPVWVVQIRRRTLGVQVRRRALGGHSSNVR